MALLTFRELRERAITSTRFASAAEVLTEATRSFQPNRSYDVFLSHSIKDAPAVLGLKTLIESHNLSVYVDWVEDTLLDRGHVTPATAAVLRSRMRSCRSLLYASSPNATGSKWMPWELGYFDGYRQRVAIVPIVDAPLNSFVGQEYLGLYPYADQRRATYGVGPLWINRPAPASDVQLPVWVKTP
jgi:hypothetical protein